MARIWQEGFEDGLPNLNYFEGEINSQFIKDVNLSYYPSGHALDSGRTTLSNHSYRMRFTHSAGYGFTKQFNDEHTESYFRMYFKLNGPPTAVVYYSILEATAIDGTILYQVLYNSLNTCTLKVLLSGSLTTVGTFSVIGNTWIKLDMYFKANATTGAYELKVDNVSKYSGSSVNTGTGGIKRIFSGNTQSTINLDHSIDDLALNDTSGSVNNSWCGDGTIVSLKPKGAGNYSQWDSSEGYAKAESGTNTTTIKITGHGIASDGVVYNKSRGEYRLVTVTDANTLTVATVTGQTENDIILLYDYEDTIANTIPTTTSDDTYVVLVGHNLESGDVFVNVDNSNSIRKVIYVENNTDEVYNYVSSTTNGILGENISAQNAGDIIKTYKFFPYAIAAHWEAVSNNEDPSPKQSYIKTTTLNDIDTYDMEELTADKSIPAGASVVAISHNMYIKEAGAGSSVKPIFRIASTDYAGNTIGISGGTLQYQAIYSLSPATSAQWTRTEVDGVEAGVKLV